MKKPQILIAAVTLMASVAFIAGCQSKDTAARAYPFDKCVVSDHKMGEMGEPVVFVYQGQTVKLCCKDCRKDFDKNPAKYLSMMQH